MFTGALIGALLAINVDLVVPLSAAGLLIAATAITVHRLSTREADWARPRKAR
jgi:hypothetical protein